MWTRASPGWRVGPPCLKDTAAGGADQGAGCQMPKQLSVWREEGEGRGFLLEVEAHTPMRSPSLITSTFQFISAFSLLHLALLLEDHLVSTNNNK